MRLVFNIDKDDIRALLVFMRPTREQKQKILDYIDSNDEVEVSDELLQTDEARELMIGMNVIALSSIAQITEE